MLTFEKLSPGFYRAHGKKGEYVLQRFDSSARYRGVVWFLTYPGRNTPDDSFTTLREAKSSVSVFDGKEVDNAP